MVDKTNTSGEMPIDKDWNIIQSSNGIQMKSGLVLSPLSLTGNVEQEIVIPMNAVEMVVVCDEDLQVRSETWSVEYFTVYATYAWTLGVAHTTSLFFTTTSNSTLNFYFNMID